MLSGIFRTVGSLALAAWLTLAPASLEAAPCAPGQWATTKFKVITIEVDEGENWWDKDQGDAIEAPPGIAGQRQRLLENKAEIYLEDIANRLQNAAFDCPPLKTVTVDGELRYLAMLSDFNRSIGISEDYIEVPGGISNGETLVANTSQLAPYGEVRTFDSIADLRENGGFYPEFYKVLAHEFGHTIELGYDRKYRSISFHKQDEPGFHFVAEGWTNALASYLLEQRFPGYRRDHETNMRDIGAFAYGTGFFPDTPKEARGSRSAYYASSFWYQYFERAGGLKAAETVLEHRFTPDGTIKGRLDWLETVLGRPMRNWLPQTMAEIVSWNRRYKAMKPKQFMTETGMVDCAVFDSGAPMPNALDAMTLETQAKRSRDDLTPYRTWCVRPFWENLRANFDASDAGYPFPEDAQLEVMIETDTAEQLNALRLSVAGSSGYVLRQCWEEKQRDPQMTCVLKEDASFSYKPPSGAHQGKLRHAKTYFLPKGPPDDGWVEFALTNVAEPYGNQVVARNVEARFNWIYNKAAKVSKTGGTGMGGMVDDATRLEFDVFSDLYNAVMPQPTRGRPGLCVFRVNAHTKGHPDDRDGMSLEMDTTKPLAVGRYEIVDRDKVGDKTENALDSVIGYFAIGRKNPQAGHLHQAFNATRGVVDITGIEGTMVSGTVTMVGKRIPPYAYKEKGGYQSLTVVADFAFDANMGRSKGYYAIGSSGSGPLSCLVQSRD